MDECHHVAASAFFGVLSRIAARYWLGLTATPERRDGLEDLIYHQLGSHHVAIDQPSTGQLSVDGSDLLTPHPLLHLHPTEFQYRGDADPNAPGGMAEIYRALVADQARLDQIVNDVVTASETGANILVLTTWVEHLNAITDRLEAAGKIVTVLSGGMKARERRQIADQLANYTPNSDPLLIVGTSSFIGEGFDCPALNTLFLAAPITFKNRLVQYIGRVTRPFPSKSTATVHDYHVRRPGLSEAREPTSATQPTSQQGRPCVQPLLAVAGCDQPCNPRGQNSLAKPRFDKAGSPPDARRRCEPPTRRTTRQFPTAHLPAQASPQRARFVRRARPPRHHAWPRCQQSHRAAIHPPRDFVVASPPGDWDSSPQSPLHRPIRRHRILRVTGKRFS